MKHQTSSLEIHSFCGLHYPKAAKICTKNRTKDEKEDVFSPSVQSEHSVFVCHSRSGAATKGEKPLSE